MENWIEKAKEIGFDHAAYLNVESLKPMQMVRDTCAADKCRAYGHNWTCPPECGTLEQCAERMRAYRHGILLQTTGQMDRVIDTKAYARTEKSTVKCFTSSPGNSGRCIQTRFVLAREAAESAKNALTPNLAGSRTRRFRPWRHTAYLLPRFAGIIIWHTITAPKRLPIRRVSCTDEALSGKTANRVSSL